MTAAARNAVAALVVCSIVLSVGAAGLPDVPPGLPGDDLPDAPAADHDSYAVEQGGTCTPVEPISGDENVAAFYDYRNPNTTRSSWLYSSFLPGSLTRDNGSTMFLYEAPDGVVSLVVVHDARKERPGNSHPHSYVTFGFDGLPNSGKWVVMDDTYADRDDEFSRTEIDWEWAGSRTDGAAFRGLAGDFGVTVSPAFDRDADRYSSTFGLEPVTSWTFLSGSQRSPNETDLAMDAPVTIHSGGCGSAPDAALAANDSAETGEEVTFDASETTDADDDVARYRWDFDGDGTTDATTDGPTATHAFESPGEYTARVTVADDGGNEANATATVRVLAPADLAVADASLSNARVAPDETVEVTATVRNAGGATGTFAANLSVGGEAVATKRVEVAGGESKTVTFSYRAETPGEHRVAVGGERVGTLVVGDGTNATESQNPSDSPDGAAGESDTSIDGDSLSLRDPAGTLREHPEWGGFALGVALLAALVAVRR